MYISLASLFDHCTQGGTSNGSDTPPSLGRHSVVDNMDTSSVLTALSKLRDLGDEGVVVLKVAQEGWELSPFHVVVAGVKLVVGRGEGVQNVVELSGELGVLVIKHAVSMHLCNGSRVVEASGLLDEGVETSIARGEEGEEPLSCGLCRGLSIVRTEEELDNVGGFPWLPPGQ